MAWTVRSVSTAVLCVVGIVLGIAALAASSAARAEGEDERTRNVYVDTSFDADRLKLSRAPDNGPAAGAANVIGQDDRVRITDTSAYPFSAISYIELYDDDYDVTGACSGTFIGPDVLLTAAHCLFDPNDGWTRHIAVAPGMDGAYLPFGYQGAQSWYVPDEWLLNSNTAWDWGIVYMGDTSLGNQVGWMRIAALSTTTLLQPDFRPAIIGYPGDVSPTGTMWGSYKERLLAVHDFELHYEIDAWWGMSGSAVFSLQEGPNLGDIVGIHSRTEFSYNVASRIDDFVIGHFLEACATLGCQLSWRIEAPANTPTASPPTATPTTTPTPMATPTRTATTVPMPAGPRPYVLRAPGLARDDAATTPPPVTQPPANTPTPTRTPAPSTPTPTPRPSTPTPTATPPVVVTSEVYDPNEPEVLFNDIRYARLTVSGGTLAVYLQSWAASGFTFYDNGLGDRSYVAMQFYFGSTAAGADDLFVGIDPSGVVVYRTTGDDFTLLYSGTWLNTGDGMQFSLPSWLFPSGRIAWHAVGAEARFSPNCSSGTCYWLDYDFAPNVQLARATIVIP